MRNKSGFNALVLAGVLGLLTQGPLAASTFTFNGPQDANGNTCDPTGPHCVIGDRLTYQMFNVMITTPAVPNGLWDLVLQTNYGVPLPGTSEVIPGYAYDRGIFAMCDFLIEWDNKYYGIVLHAHDGYTAGDLYESPNGFQTSGAVMGAQGVLSPRPYLPALLAAGASQIGTGILSASANPGADGLTQALYRVEVAFLAPTDFLAAGPFTIHACSYACDNGYITGTQDLLVPGEDIVVPEPATWSLMLLGAGAIGWARRRR